MAPGIGAFILAMVKGVHFLILFISLCMENARIPYLMYFFFFLHFLQ